MMEAVGQGPIQCSYTSILVDNVYMFGEWVIAVPCQWPTYPGLTGLILSMLGSPRRLAVVSPSCYCQCPGTFHISLWPSKFLSYLPFTRPINHRLMPHFIWKNLLEIWLTRIHGSRSRRPTRTLGCKPILAVKSCGSGHDTRSLNGWITSKCA